MPHLAFRALLAAEVQLRAWSKEQRLWGEVVVALWPLMLPVVGKQVLIPFAFHLFEQPMCEQGPPAAL